VALTGREGREFPGDGPQNPGELSGRLRRHGGPQARHGHSGDQRPGMGGQDQAPRRPGSYLDIFSQRLVERISGGWQITSKGRAVLEFMEARAAPEQIPAPLVEDARAAIVAPTPVPPLRQPADRAKRRRERRRANGRGQTLPKARSRSRKKPPAERGGLDSPGLSIATPAPSVPPLPCLRPCPSDLPNELRFGYRGAELCTALLQCR